MIDKRDKIDKVLQCMLDFSLRHNVRFTLLNLFVQKIVEQYISSKAKRKRAKKDEDVVCTAEKGANQPGTMFKKRGSMPEMMTENPPQIREIQPKAEVKIPVSPSMTSHPTPRLTKPLKL